MLGERLDSSHLQQLFPNLRLLLLYGSRGRGDAHPGSDWDFAYLADGALDELALRAALSHALHTDAIDLVNLDRASGVLRYQAARDGQPVLEREPNELDRFAQCAIRFWLEVGPLLEAEHSALLGRLG